MPRSRDREQFPLSYFSQIRIFYLNYVMGKVYWSHVHDRSMGDLEVLKETVDSIGKMAIAFSGGADSSLLAYVAKEVLGDDTACFMILNQAIPEHEVENAAKVANEIGIELNIIRSDIEKMEEMLVNEEDRCGKCRSVIMPLLIEEASKKGFDIVADGANMDDLSDHRPGHLVSTHLGILHPLIDSGIRKVDVRRILKDVGLSVHDKPSTPCLATRVPYGQRITVEKLDIIKRAENELRDMGFRNIRVRLYRMEGTQYLGVVEVDEPGSALSRWNEISSRITDIKLVLDPLGYRQGSLNRGQRP